MMKIQEMAIIFVIIMLPISIILSAYTQFQIQTLNNQILYDTKLTSSTFDAIKAFQLNTANSTLQDISDSKIRDIEASVKTFKNSMVSTFRLNGYTEDDLNNYIPALVYTMYDGFYIYSPYENTVDSTGTVKTTSGDTIYGLKPYISYSCRYVRGTTDVVITYTLDNYITIQGMVNETYTNKSGYLIDNIDVGTSVTYNTVTIDDTETMKEYVPDAGGDIKEYQYVKYNGTKYYYDEKYEGYTEDPSAPKPKGQIFYYANGTFTQYAKNSTENDRFLELYPKKNDSHTRTIQYKEFNGQTRGETYPLVEYNGVDYYFDKDAYSFFYYENNDTNNKRYQIKGDKTYNDMKNAIENNSSAKNYYKKAQEFTKYVEENLGELTFENAREYTINENGTIEDEGPIWPENKRKIFPKYTGIATDINIENKSSNFNQHRLEVIRHTIEKNLSIAIKNYNTYSSVQDIEFQMPKLKEQEWDLVMNNISLISFVQGLDIGGKIYNGYAIVNNTESKEVVQEGRIFILGADGYYHKIGDRYLEENADNVVTSKPAGRLNLDFKRQNMTIEGKNQTIYYYPVKYDLKNSYKGSYDSIVTQNNVEDVNDIYKYVSDKNDNLKKAFYMAIAREREATYKSATTSVK